MNMFRVILGTGMVVGGGAAGDGGLLAEVTPNITEGSPQHPRRIPGFEPRLQFAMACDARGLASSS